MKNKKHVMVIAAHPDDEVLGCGGAIIKHVNAGDEVCIIVLADGVTSRIYDPLVSRTIELKQAKMAIAMRKKEFFRAAKILGVKSSNCFWLGLPDQRLDAVPLLDIIKQIEKISAKICPDIVYTHHWGDLNRDHRVCCEAAMTAFRPSRSKVEFYCFEVSGNMGLLPPIKMNKFEPDRFVDISSFIEGKVKALSAYKSELRDYPLPLSQKSVLKTAKMRGKKKKVKFAETFVSWR